MKTRTIFLLVFISISYLSTLASNPFYEMNNDDTTITKSNDELVVVWTSGDPEVANKMVFMYTYNAKKYEWWENITFIVWGPSSKLLSEDTELQESLKKMKEAGIKLEACKACADMYEVSDKLTELGVDVKYMGDVLTN